MKRSKIMVMGIVSALVIGSAGYALPGDQGGSGKKTEVNSGVKFRGRVTPKDV